MQQMRSRLMTLLLTVFVGLGLASVSLAHRLPSVAEQGAAQAVEALQAAGLPLAEICGQTQDKRACPEQSCPICRGAASGVDLAFVLPPPMMVPLSYREGLPKGRLVAVQRLMFGHDAQGPPAALI